MDNSGLTIPGTSFGLRALKAEVRDLAGTLLAGQETRELLRYVPANLWMEEASQRPIPKQLWSVFWHEGELCIMYADTNLGKSILGIQIADEISRSQVVIYVDCELSDKQFEARYSFDYKNHYPFSENLFRAEINPDGEIPDGQTFESSFMDSISKMIETTGAKVLFIDNITYLSAETEKARDALPLMKQLKQLKSKYALSILALAHTPKRDASKPLTRNDLQGSKMLINFCDSAFAIGESATDKNVRYVKQIKARATEIMHGDDNVCIYEVVKPDNFLYFRFLNYGREREHLNAPSETDRDQLVSKVKELSQQSKNQRVIASELGISVGAVNKYLKL